MMVGREVRLCGAGATLLLCLSCGPGDAAFRQGRKAELRKDYDTAVINFEKALQYEPENPHYLVHDKLARQKASFFHLRQGQRLLAENRQEEASGEFQKAVGVDPTNQAAAQELTKLLAAQAAAKAERQKEIQQSLKVQEDAPAPLGVQLNPFPPEPLGHFHITGDSRKVFEILGKQANLNVAFTSDFQPKPLSLDLTNIKLEDLFHIAALSANVFWKAITPNTIAIIPDTQQNRQKYEDEVLRTYHLSNPLADADRTAMTTAMKTVLRMQNVVDSKDSNSIILRDTPEKVAAAEELIRSLDLGKAEVLVDVTILEANRDRMRNLGLTPAYVGGGSTTAALGFTPRSVNPAPGQAAASSLPLNRLGRIGSADFSIALPGAVANALLSDTQTRILQNPQVRATDGMKATLKIGTRYPYATGSFLPSFGGGITGGQQGAQNFGLLASTQFQYQDVGVNLEITPHVSASGEVTLHASIEISSVGANVPVGGITEPSFGQRKIEHDIRLKEGEVSLLGGLIQRQENRTVSGVPVLSQIPLLGHFFSTESRDVMNTEVLIMLTPHIIRLPEIAGGATKGVLVGGDTGGPAPRVFTPPEVVRPRPGQPPGERP